MTIKFERDDNSPTTDRVKEIEDRRSELNALLCAFVQGAKWWDHHTSGFTMWQSDQRLALEEAEKLLENGSLGKPSA